MNAHEHFTPSLRCPDCGGEQREVYTSRYMEVVDPSTDAWSGIKAKVCLVCGNLTLYATNPSTFIRQAKQHQEEGE